jgi:hypothetical protein
MLACGFSRLEGAAIAVSVVSDPLHLPKRSLPIVSSCELTAICRCYSTGSDVTDVNVRLANFEQNHDIKHVFRMTKGPELR